MNNTIGPASGEAGFFLDFQGLNKLRADARHDSPKAVHAAARQFEALFLQMMLKSMRKATEGFQSGLFSNDQTRFYQGLADQQLALSLSRDTGMGLAKLLVQQLDGHRNGKSAAAARTGGAIPLHRPDKGFPLRRRAGIPLHRPASGRTVTASPTPVTPVTPVTAATAARAPGATVPTGGPLGFVRRIWPLARAAGAALGVGPAVLVAQAALETGWGRALVRHPDGRSTHNLFGIKAGPAWSGPTAAVPTVEYRDGVASRGVDRFRAYGSYAESFADYVRLLRTDPRYRAALAGATDPGAFTAALQEAGYATDPHYARKIQRVLQGATLQNALAALKVGDGRPLI